MATSADERQGLTFRLEQDALRFYHDLSSVVLTAATQLSISEEEFIKGWLQSRAKPFGGDLESDTERMNLGIAQADLERQQCLKEACLEIHSSLQIETGEFNA